MGIRGSSVVRCPGCGLHRGDCLCAEAPRLACATPVVLFQHALDAERPSNTGRLVTAMLSGSETIIVGRPGGVPPWSPPPGRPRWILHPDGRPLVADDRARRPCLLVPDGTWSQTRRMSQRVSWLREAEPVRVDVEGPRGAVLRQPRKPGLLCTLEAVAHALAVIESPDVAEAMLDVLDELVARALIRRGGDGRPRSDP